jgi:filamentous hemagglutinin
MYQSQICDWESGKYYWKYRYYDTSTGRWLNHDPIGEWGGMNLYGFVCNSPVNNFDSDGRFWDSFAEWELNILHSIKHFFIADPGEIKLADEGYRAGTGLLEPIRDANGNDITQDVIAGVALAPLEAMAVVPLMPEMEGADEVLLAAKTTKCEKVADAISRGHAYAKHVLKEGQFDGATASEFADMLQFVMEHPSATRALSNGRTAYYDANSGLVVIVNPNAADMGTAFVPANPSQYFYNTIK